MTDVLTPYKRLRAFLQVFTSGEFGIRAKEQGIHVGRPADTNEEILEKYPEIVKALQQGMGLRTIAREFGVSRNTVRKVQSALS